MIKHRIGVLDSNLAVNQVWFDFEDFIKSNLLLQTHEPSTSYTPNKIISDAESELLKNFVYLDSRTLKINEPTGVCNFFLKGHCWKGEGCQYRHVPMPVYNEERKKQFLQQQKRNFGGNEIGGEVVCKHWLRGLCKKGDKCEFLHEYNLLKMPECWFYAKYGECGNSEECVYQHIDPDSRIKICPWYARGFCKNGPHCKRKHQRKIACKPYLFGFCPLGPNCPNDQ
ncbi:hypothetical protein BB559_005632 [Furculomyces boomerangus]|uniref:mRNA 3'-end-processing protein n=1 Tax=Furculomyces boomerangus TaxID=61424 RepID=A0A2T9Y7K7_9FUNG|nr:hypothetical protein BB559_005632 [Furculomyces boomerangus]